MQSQENQEKKERAQDIITILNKIAFYHLQFLKILVFKCLYNYEANNQRKIHQSMRDICLKY